MFIDYGVALLLGGDRIDGVRLTWTFDDLFSGFILQEFDRDRNGTLSTAEIRQIEEKHFAEFRRARFFTAVSVNGQGGHAGRGAGLHGHDGEGHRHVPSSHCPSARRSGRRPRSRSLSDDPTYYIAYMAAAASAQTQTAGAFVIDCRVAHDKTGMTPDAVRCGVRRR